MNDWKKRMAEVSEIDGPMIRKHNDIYNGPMIRKHNDIYNSSPFSRAPYRVLTHMNV